MAVAGLYRRILPSPPAIEFASSEGKQLFSEALQSGTMEGFFKLISYFQTQSEPAYCALASLSMVLNALAIDPGRKWKGPWRWFDESMLDCCEPLEKIKAEGITFGKVACLAHCAGAKVEAFHTTQSTLSDFRNHVMKCTSSEDCHLITSYHRKAFKQESRWAMQLLSVACLSLAAKMEETLVPSLLDLQVEGARFIFEPRTICKMELLVLTALKWRLRSVTPFTFIHFFAYKADPTGTHTTKLVSRATDIILATILDVDFLDHCPSSMAAAAVICAADCISSDLSLANPVSAMAWCIGLTREGITSCYQLMQQVVMSMSSEASSSSSSTSSTPPTKRRKLNTCLWVWVDDDNEGKEAD